MERHFFMISRALNARKRKIFALFFALAASIGLSWASTVVTITNNDFPNPYGSSLTKDGVTVSAEFIDGMEGNIMGEGSFSTTLGNFTQIEVTAEDVSSISGTGWTGNSQKKTWTGNASSVSFSGDAMGLGQGITLKFTIGDAAPARDPQRFTDTVKIEDLVVGDTLAMGAKMNSDQYFLFYCAPNRARRHGNLWTSDFESFFLGSADAISKHGAIDLENPDGLRGCLEPVNENGELAEEWIVTSTNPFTIAGIRKAEITNHSYRSEVDYAALEPGDTIAFGASITNTPEKVWFLANRMQRIFSSGEISIIDDDRWNNSYGTIGKNGVINADNYGTTQVPINEQGTVGGKWVVKFYSPLTIAGIGYPMPTLTLSDQVSIVGMPVAGIKDIGNDNYEVEPGTQFQIQAAAAPEHYNFVGWSDLDTTDPNYSANPRTITINSDLTIKPLYALETFTITLTSNDTTMGKVTMHAGSGGGEDGDMSIANNADLEGANTSRNIAVGADGSIHVVYKSTEDQSVKYIKSIDGVTFTEPVTVANGARECEVTVSSNGKVYVSYYIEDGAAYIAYSADGTSFTSVMVEYNALSIHLATDGDYVYAVNKPGTNFYYSSDGGQTYNMHSDWSGYMFSDVMVDPLTHNVVVIKDEPAVVVRYSTDHGATFTEEAPVMVQGGNDQLAIFFSTATMGDGKVYMAGSDAFVAIIDYKTATCTKTDVNSTENRSLCADPVGNVIVGVEQGENLYYQLSTNSAVSFGENVLVSNGSGANAALNYHDGTLLYLFTKDNKLYLATRTGIVPTESVVDNGDGTYAVQYGTEVTFTAKAKPGYHVESWSNAVEVNDIIVATQTLEVNSAMTIGATFAANPILTIATNDSTKGVVSVEGAGQGASQGEPTTEVIITQDDFPTGSESLTKDGVTVSAGWIDGTTNDIAGEGSFSTTLGNFTKIEIYAMEFSEFSGEGWTEEEDYERVWTGNASSVSFSGDIMGDGQGVTLKFTIGDAAPATEGIIDLGGGQYNVVPGTELTFVAKPAEEHYLVSWNDEPATSDTLKLTMNGELAVNATFAHVPYIYTLPEGVSIVEPMPAGITAKGEGIYEIVDGTQFQISADSIPAHYHFDHWADLADSVAQYAANPRTIVAGENLTVEPIFAIDTYTLTLATNDSTKGVVSVIGAGSGAGASVGEMIELSEKQTENPVMGEYFQVAGEGVNYEGRIIGRSDDYQLTISSQNGEKLDFIILKVSSKSLWSGYTVSSTAGNVEDLLDDNNTIRISNINATSVTISRSGTTANPTGHIIVSNVYVNEEIPFRFDMTDFEFPNSGNVLTGYGATLTAGGSFDLATPQIVGGGTFTTDLGNFTKIEIYSMGFSEFSGEGWTEVGDYERIWTGNASSVSFGGAVLGDGMGTIFISYTIALASAASAASGIVDNGDGTYTVDYGTELTFVAKPAEGFMLDSWSNGAPVTGDTLKLTMTEELSLTANFKHIPATITLPEGVSIVEPMPAGITSKGEGVYEVEYGTEFRISADSIPAHYHFDHWADLADSVAQYAANPRTIVAGENLTVEPIFAIDTYTLTLATNDSTKGVVSVEGAGQGGQAEPITVTFTNLNSVVKVVENITLPHTFSCDYTNGNGELDLIIQESYNETGGRCSTSREWPWGGNDNEVVVGHDGNNHFVTINAPFVGTSFMSGYYDGSSFGNFYYSFHITTAAAAPAAASGIVDNGDGTYTVDWGTELTFVAKPAEGFMLESWSNGAEVTGDTLKLTMTEELSLTANFKHIPATITLPEGVSIVEPMPAGITSKGEGVYEVEYGTEFRISADSIPAHHHFDHWADLADSAAMYAANPRTIVAGENLTIEPIFAIDTYTLTLATNDSTMGIVSLEGAGQGGLQEPSAQLIVPESWSSEVGVTITAADLPGFVASTEEAVKALPVPTEGSVFVIYNFKEEVDPSGGAGNASVEAVTFENGEYVRTTSSPVDHANASYYSNQGMIFLYTTAAGQAGQGGEGEEPEGIVDNGDGTYTVDWGTELTFVAQPAEGFMLDSWSNGAEVTGDTLKLTMTEELSLTANFKYIPAVITLPEGVNIVEPLPAGITALGEGVYEVEHGTEFQISADGAPEHYHFDHWADLDSTNTEYYANPRTVVADTNFTANPFYTIDTYVITLASNDTTMGKLTIEPADGIVANGDGTYTVDWGTELTFVAVPAEDYHLLSWSNGAAVTADNKQTLTITDQLSLSAFFKHDTYILTVEGAEVEVAKFADGTADAVVLNPGTLVGVQAGDSVKLTTTATYSSTAIGDDLTITLHYAIEVIDGGIYDNEYALEIEEEEYSLKGAILEPMNPDKDASAEDPESEVEEGLEIQAYGYCHGSEYSIRYHLKSGNPNQYKVEFADARFTDVDWTDLEVTGKDGTIDIEIPIDVPTGDYSMTITFRDSRYTWLESAPITVSFHVNLPETYVVALFDDVMAVVDTCECLTDIQWYWRANSTDQWQAIEGATGYYYKQAGGLSGEFFIHAKMNGIDTYTCPQEDLSLYADGKRAKVTAYPNPVQSTTTVTIENSYRFEHDMRIVNLMGSEVLNTTFEGNTTTVEMDAFPHGSYIISVDGVVVNVMKQ